MAREKIGKALFHISSYIFFLAVILFVWTRNHFYDFGVSTPSIKPSDVLLPLALIFFLAGLFFSRELRGNPERNSLLLRSLGMFGIFALSLGIGALWRVVVLGLPLTPKDLHTSGRILLGFTALFLTLAFSFRNERFAKWIFFAFLANIVLIPFLFMPIASIVTWLLVVSTVSYTFLGFQNSTIVLGFSIMVTLTLFFSLYMFQKNRGLKALFFITCFLLAGVLFWTGSRAAWFAAVASLVGIVLMTSWGNMKKMAVGFAEIVALFVVGFAILPPIIRNTAIVRVFPRLDIPTRADSFAFFQLPTHEFIRTDQFIFDVGFQVDRGAVWKIYAENFLQNPFGVGPAYASIFGVKNFSAQGVNAHDLWLQVAVSGGIGALTLLIILFLMLGRELVALVRKRRDQFTVGLFGAFCGVLVAVTFIDSLELRWLWALVGLMVIWAYNEKYAL